MDLTTSMHSLWRLLQQVRRWDHGLFLRERAALVAGWFFAGAAVLGLLAAAAGLIFQSPHAIMAFPPALLLGLVAYGLMSTAIRIVRLPASEDLLRIGRSCDRLHRLPMRTRGDVLYAMASAADRSIRGKS